jgi:ketosteroid isomerase-like protein
MPNVRSLVETYYETYGRHDLDGLLAMMDDDVRIHFPVDEKPKTLASSGRCHAARRSREHPDRPRRRRLGLAYAERRSLVGRIR